LFVVIIVASACRGPSSDPVPANRSEPAAPATPSGKFEGTIGAHHFSIVIDGGQVTQSARDNWTWRLGSGRVALQDSGPIDAQTPNLVARSPRTIMRNSDGLWVVTEVVVTAGGRAFTCLHQQVVSGEGTAEAKAAAALGIATCSSLHVDP